MKLTIDKTQMKTTGIFNMTMLPREKYKRLETLLELELYVNGSVARDLHERFGVSCRLRVEEIEENNRQSWTDFRILA